MNVLAEPVAQRRELAPLDLLLEVGAVVEELLPDLYRHDRPEQIRREVADLTRRPMRVLQDTLRVVRHVDAEVLVHLVVPHARQVANLDAAVDDLLLELEAQDHMHAVRDLVRPDPDQRRLDAVDAGDEVVEVDAPELIGESRLRARVEEPPERAAATDEVLP